MRTSISTITFMLLTVVSLGQRDSSRISIGVHCSPDYCYRTRHLNFGFQSNIDTYNSVEIPKLGYTAGPTVLFNIGNRLEFETGLLWSNKGFRTREIATIHPGPNTTYIPTAQSNFNLYCIDIPLMLNGVFGNGRFQMIGSVSITPNISVLNTRKTDHKTSADHTETTKTTNSDPALWLTPEVGAGVSYQISQKITVRAIPRFRYTFTWSNDEPIGISYWSAGLDVAGYIKF